MFVRGLCSAQRFLSGLHSYCTLLYNQRAHSITSSYYSIAFKLQVSLSRDFFSTTFSFTMPKSKDKSKHRKHKHVSGAASSACFPLTATTAAAATSAQPLPGITVPSPDPQSATVTVALPPAILTPGSVSSPDPYRRRRLLDRLCHHTRA